MAKCLCVSERPYKIYPPCFRVLLEGDEHKRMQAYPFGRMGLGTEVLQGTNISRGGGKVGMGPHVLGVLPVFTSIRTSWRQDMIRRVLSPKSWRQGIRILLKTGSTRSSVGELAGVFHNATNNPTRATVIHLFVIYVNRNNRATLLLPLPRGVRETPQFSLVNIRPMALAVLVTQR